MGIRFIDSILALVATAAFVFSAYLVGHALSSEHAGWAWASAPVFLLAGAGLGWLTARRIRTYARGRGERLHS